MGILTPFNDKYAHITLENNAEIKIRMSKNKIHLTTSEFDGPAEGIYSIPEEEVLFTEGEDVSPSFKPIWEYTDLLVGNFFTYSCFQALSDDEDSDQAEEKMFTYVVPKIKTLSHIIEFDRFFLEIYYDHRLSEAIEGNFLNIPQFFSSTASCVLSSRENDNLKEYHFKFVDGTWYYDDEIVINIASLIDEQHMVELQHLIGTSNVTPIGLPRANKKAVFLANGSFLFQNMPFFIITEADDARNITFAGPLSDFAYSSHYSSTTINRLIGEQ